MRGNRIGDYEQWPDGGVRPTLRVLKTLAVIYGTTWPDLIDAVDLARLPERDRRAWLDESADTLDRPSNTARRSRPVKHPSASRGPVAALPVAAGPDLLRSYWPHLQMAASITGSGGTWDLELPRGRCLDGAGHLTVQVQPLEITSDAAQVPVGNLQLSQLTAHRHAMLIAADQRTGTFSPRGICVREVRRQITRAGDIPSAVVIPEGCELDDLSYAIIWALAGIDDALLADDGLLDERRKELRRYEALPESAVSGSAAAGLTPTARMWLGSSFCARHILRNLAGDGPPMFWTREQTGEEACTWLVFRHKHSYLTRLSEMFSRSGGEPLIRGFCLPERIIAVLPRWERILLFLAVALMESFSIQVQICAEPSYANVDGFALQPSGRAVIATWVRADGIWYAGARTDLSATRDFRDITGYVRTHSATAATTPAGRLRALAGYLDLDWSWLIRRCAGLGEAGCATLIEPHSRLLSTAGVDAALRFAGSLTMTGTRVAH
jgi:hypothetical protein